MWILNSLPFSKEWSVESRTDVPFIAEVKRTLTKAVLKSQNKSYFLSITQLSTVICVTTSLPGAFRVCGVDKT